MRIVRFSKMSRYPRFVKKRIKNNNYKIPLFTKRTKHEGPEIIRTM